MPRVAAVTVAALIVLVGADGLTGQSGPPPLVVNGSFEDAPPTRIFLNLVPGASSLPGWQVIDADVDIVGRGSWPASHGVHSIDLDGYGHSRSRTAAVNGAITQTFGTTPGTRYLVTFDMAGNPAGPPAIKRMRLSAGDQSMEFTFDTTGKSARKMGWRTTSWTFAATEATSTLAFRSLSPSPVTRFGAAIDNVSVTALDARQPLSVTENEKEIQISLGAEVLFDTGRFTLRPAAADALDKVAALVKSYPGLPVLIEGHTDGVGRPEANQVLSENRAAAVKQWLTSQGGVPPGRLTARGRGQTMPAANNDTADGRQRNRRVEIRLQKTGADPGR